MPEDYTKDVDEVERLFDDFELSKRLEDQKYDEELDLVEVEFELD